MFEICQEWRKSSNAKTTKDDIILGIWCKSPDLKKLHKIVKLTMNIANDGNRRWYIRNIAFVGQNTLRGLAQTLNLGRSKGFNFTQAT